MYKVNLLSFWAAAGTIISEFRAHCIQDFLYICLISSFHVTPVRSILKPCRSHQSTNLHLVFYLVIISSILQLIRYYYALSKISLKTVILYPCLHKTSYIFCPFANLLCSHRKNCKDEDSSSTSHDLLCPDVLCLCKFIDPNLRNLKIACKYLNLYFCL